MDAAIEYLLQHRQMQFSNTRSVSGKSALQPLNGVMWFQIGREPVTIYKPEHASSESEAHWGGRLIITVHCRLALPDEILI
jgi:hypothetical protein